MGDRAHALRSGRDPAGTARSRCREGQPARSTRDGAGHRGPGGGDGGAGGRGHLLPGLRSARTERGAARSRRYRPGHTDRREGDHTRAAALRADRRAPCRRTRERVGTRTIARRRSDHGRAGRDSPPDGPRLGGERRRDREAGCARGNHGPARREPVSPAGRFVALPDVRRRIRARSRHPAPRAAPRRRARPR